MSDVRRRLDPSIESPVSPDPGSLRLEASNDTSSTYVKLGRFVEGYIKAMLGRPAEKPSGGDMQVRLMAPCGGLQPARPDEGPQEAVARQAEPAVAGHSCHGARNRWCCS